MTTAHINNVPKLKILTELIKKITFNLINGIDNNWNKV